MKFGNQEAEALLAEALGVEEAFPWQRALLRRFLEGTPPTALDIPTGLGKTAIMAAWLLARAAGADVPTRLVYVVDRRAVVDQATAVAERLRASVSSRPELRDGLGLEGPLPISTLRGQYADNREWLANPTSPALIVGTVDMVGSRLLFQGYGVSWKMRPFHAGLLGADTLFVLDEAHLSAPFERLLATVAEAHRGPLGPEEEVRELLPPVRFVSLSATGRGADDALTLSEEDRAHPVVRKRIFAEKRLVLRPPVARRELWKRLLEEAQGLSSRGAKRILIYCNSREDALNIGQQLERATRKEGHAVELLVGARRVHERRRVAKWLEETGFTGNDDPQQTAFLVATSAGEVGVDLDADACVMDVVAWERMVQRLGRVNRRGKGAAQVVVVPIDEEDRGTVSRKACVELLQRLPQVEGGVSGSPDALATLRVRSETDTGVSELMQAATTPAPLRPELSRPLLDAWAMTSLREHTGRPAVAPWLRGWVDDPPQTVVVFRSQLPVAMRGERWELFPASMLESFLEAAGPQLPERLEATTSDVVRWLGDRLRAWKASQRNEGSGLPLAIGIRGTDEPLPIVAVDSARDRARLERQLAGATLLVDQRLGGVSEGLLDPKADGPPPEQGPLDLTLEAPRPEGEPELPFRTWTEESVDAVHPGFQLEASFPIAFDDEGQPSRWLLVKRGESEQAVSEAGRSVARRAQTLVEHQRWVEDEARAITRQAGLDPRLAQAVHVAARLHDEGKRAERWQQAFGIPSSQRPLAKSTSAPNVALLGGYRHELGSLPHVERDAEFRELDEDQQDLVLHLVAAHHGRARPTLPIEGAEEPPSLLRQRAEQIALRFERLSRRFGPWGLAWLESLLRSADQRASRRNDRNDEGVEHG